MNTLTATHSVQFILEEQCITVQSWVWGGGGYIRDTRWGNFYMQADAENHICVKIFKEILVWGNTLGTLYGDNQICVIIIMYNK